MRVIDAHCDTLYMRALHKGRTPGVTPERLAAGNVNVQVCALFVGSGGPAGKPVENVRAQLACLRELTGCGVRQIRDLEEAEDGGTCMLLSLEGGEALAGSLDALHAYYAAGVRMLTLTWNFENELGFPHCVEPQRPLKPFGIEAVGEMNRLGIAVDVSHLGIGGFWDLMERADKAPMASHSCCRALHDHTRNLSDDQLAALLERGGWIGINFYPVFLTGGEADIQDVLRHIDHIVQMGGAKHVGFGSDFDGIERVPDGLEHPGKFPALVEALIAAYGEETARDIAGENFVRYMGRIAP